MSNSDDNETHFPLNINFFERTTPDRLIRKKTALFKCKLWLFCALHRPVSSNSRFYHYFFIALVLFNCIGVNVFDEYFGTQAVIWMAVMDLGLTGLLTIELILRLWSSEYKYDYQGFNGKLLYLRDHCVQRAFDFFGILTFMTFICFQRFDGSIGIVLRLLHILQVCQLYRLLKPLLKLMISTVVDQFHQLYIALIFASIILVLTSFSIYLREMAETESNKNIFDAFWFGYITLSTIGYGDITPTTDWGKVLTCVLAFCGICMFQLPANIFGTGLAIKLREQQKWTLYRTPASNLIQTIWRCYATDSESKLTSVWNSFRKQSKANSESSLPLTEADKQCIRFILKIQYMRTRTHFRFELNPKRNVNESVEQLELLRRVNVLELTLKDLKDRTSILNVEFGLITDKLQKLLTEMESF